MGNAINITKISGGRHRWSVDVWQRNGSLVLVVGLADTFEQALDQATQEQAKSRPPRGKEAT